MKLLVYVLALSLSAQSFDPTNPIFARKTGLVRGGLVAGYDLRTVNFALQSEAITVSPWTNNSGAVTVTTLSDPPDGVSTAQRMTLPATWDGKVQSLTIPANGTYTVSVWLRGSGTVCVGRDPNANVTLTEAWVRYSLSAAETAGAGKDVFIIRNMTSTATSVDVAGIQLNAGPTALPYVRTTGGQSVANMVPGGAALQLGSTSGVDTNDPTRGATGLVFDGVDDYAQTPHRSELALVNDLTISIVTNPLRSSGTWDRYISKSRSPYNIVVDNTTGKLRLVRSNGVTQAEPVSNTVLTAGAWVGFTLTERSRLAQFYLGPTLDGGGTVTITPNDNGTILAVGADAGGHNYFNGTISFVLIYSRALSPREIRINHNWLKAQMAQVGVTLP